MDRYLLYLYTAFAIVYLMLPIAVMILFCFNDPPGKSNFDLARVLARRLAEPVRRARAVRRRAHEPASIAFVSTIVATALGTLIALALVRYEFRGSGATNLLIFLPMATPEIVLGRVAADAVRGDRGPPFFPTNFLTILIAHIMFNISFVVVTVRARLDGFRSPPRGGGDGPRRQRVDDVLEGHLPADPARASWPRPCSPSACRSTTS